MSRILSMACALALSFSAVAAGHNPIPASSWVERGIDDAAVREMLTAHPSDAVEGIWSATADGARIAIIPGMPPGFPNIPATGICLLFWIRRVPALCREP